MIDICFVNYDELSLLTNNSNLKIPKRTLFYLIILKF